jgi:hypothetical protein
MGICLERERVCVCVFLERGRGEERRDGIAKFLIALCGGAFYIKRFDRKKKTLD